MFEKKDDVGAAVKSELDVSMKVYGFEIPNALVTDVNPADNVKAAMNEIQTQQRLQVAAAAKGEANKILVVKNAEAEAESKHLQGEGIAKQRRAIIDGLRESIAAFTDKIGSVNEHEVLNLVLLTQYFDTMKEIGVSSGSKVILMPHSPAGMSDITESDSLRHHSGQRSGFAEQLPKRARCRARFARGFSKTAIFVRYAMSVAMRFSPARRK